MTSTILGGWTTFSSDISQEALGVFEAALKGRVGVSYSPVAVATQIVSGTNYSFFCNTKMVVLDAANEAAVINIYQPLQGEPEITEIKTVSH